MTSRGKRIYDVFYLASFEANGCCKNNQSQLLASIKSADRAWKVEHTTLATLAFHPRRWTPPRPYEQQH